MFTVSIFRGVFLACGKLQISLRNLSEIHHTALYDFHVKHGGKMINFGGYLLPVQYADQSISSSHLHTRRYGSIFDVSHMLQTYVRGKDAVTCIESLCTADIKGMPSGTGRLTLFTNSNGGVLDDLIVSKINNECLYIVSNAATKTQNMEIIQEAQNRFKSIGKSVDVEFLSTKDQALIAIQGPQAVPTLQKLIPKTFSLDQLFFMQTIVLEVAGIKNCRITRCGYTGEDGVEISVPSSHVQHVIEALLYANENIKLAGLGARDSLRLESGLCLYGTDITAQTTPVEAGLAWLIGRRRRSEANFPGAKRILGQLYNCTKVTQRRMGFIMVGKNKVPSARAGVQIYNQNKLVGHVTSGCPSPSLGKNIAMGYIVEKLCNVDNLVHFKIRNSFYSAITTRMPFVKPHSYMKPKIYFF